MSEAATPELEGLGEQHFSFYPAIVNIEHNEWILRRATWSEILISNAKTGLELWVPRRYVGEVSSVDEPIVIVGLNKELEFKAGAVWPRHRRLISMPRAGGPFLPSGGTPEDRPPVSGGRPAPGPEAKVGRLIGGVLLLGVALIVLVVAITQRPVTYKGIEQLSLQLTGEDDYHSIVRKLGMPSEDHWRPETGELKYRALRFKDHSYTLILMGVERDGARYIGAMDKDWKPVHSVRVSTGDTTLAMLRRLPKF
jgi:hypothetical protein